MYNYVVTELDTHYKSAGSYPFETKEEAEEYLLRTWEDKYNTALGEYDDLIEQSCWHEDACAQVMWNDGTFAFFTMTKLHYR